MPLLRACKCGTKAYDDEDLELFEKATRNKHGRTNRCKECANKKSKKYRDEEGPDKVRNAHIKSKYHITAEEYDKCMDTSDKCEKCGKYTDLCYDHDHSTMKFRGVLCRQCNSGIGLLGDTEQGVQQALNYFKTRNRRD